MTVMVRLPLPFLAKPPPPPGATDVRKRKLAVMVTRKTHHMVLMKRARRLLLANKQVTLHALGAAIPSAEKLADDLKELYNNTLVLDVKTRTVVIEGDGDEGDPVGDDDADQSDAGEGGGEDGRERGDRVLNKEAAGSRESLEGMQDGKSEDGTTAMRQGPPNDEASFGRRSGTSAANIGGTVRRVSAIDIHIKTIE